MVSRILLAVALASCATAEKDPYVNCPQPLIVLFDGQKWNDYDRNKLTEMRSECKKRYKGCVYRVNKVRDRGYTVVCRKPEEY
jgi:hypothetical protein